MQDDSKSARDKGRRSLLEGWNSPPNLVTYVRILLVIVFIVLYARAGAWGHANMGMRWIAALLFTVAASTDKLDGYLARKYNQITELGKLMDPIADKLLICSTLIVASAFGELYWWVTILFLIRELGITVMRFFVIDSGGQVIAASKAGKYKTLFQCLGLALLITPLSSVGSWYLPIVYAIIMIALILCLYSGGVYVYNVFSNRKA